MNYLRHAIAFDLAFAFPISMNQLHRYSPAFAFAFAQTHLPCVVPLHLLEMPCGSDAPTFDWRAPFLSPNPSANSSVKWPVISLCSSSSSTC